ncbi:MAG: hypothetical protein VX730_09595 [Pseudomonadota bacterium]|nr:hypothetical protein [Pseudomonadota bacterium]
MSRPLSKLTVQQAEELSKDADRIWAIFPSMRNHAFHTQVDPNGRPDGPVIHIYWYGISHVSVQNTSIPDRWLLQEHEWWDASILKSLPPVVRLTTSLEDFHAYSLEDKKLLLEINPHLLPLTFTENTQIGFFQHHLGEEVHRFLREEKPMPTECTIGQARYLAKQLNEIHSMLQTLFPSMQKFNASCRVTGLKGIPVIIVTWTPGGGLPQDAKLTPKIIQEMNTNWEERHQEVLDDLPTLAHIKRGRPKKLTTFTFRHQAGYLET